MLPSPLLMSPILLRDVWIRTQRAGANMRGTNLATLPWTKELKDTNPLMSSLLVICLGLCSNFVGSESGQKQSVKLLQNMVYSTIQPPPPPPPVTHHGVRLSNHTYVALALLSLLATCVVFWSHRRRDIVYTAAMFSPERMYMTLDGSASTSYPSLQRHKCIYRCGKATGLHQLSSFLLSQ